MSGFLTEDQLNQTALRIASQCRQIIEPCLREEEWLDAEQEFLAVIVAELQANVGGGIVQRTPLPENNAPMTKLLRESVNQEWLSPAELARLIGRTPYTVRQWCRRGRLKARKRTCGRGSHLAWEIPADEVQHYRNHGLRPADSTGALPC